jgi:hypothetical protein
MLYHTQYAEKGATALVAPFSYVREEFLMLPIKKRAESGNKSRELPSVTSVT